jgi:hypothetical protein
MAAAPENPDRISRTLAQLVSFAGQPSVQDHLLDESTKQDAASNTSSPLLISHSNGGQ